MCGKDCELTDSDGASDVAEAGVCFEDGTCQPICDDCKPPECDGDDECTCGEACRIDGVNQTGICYPNNQCVVSDRRPNCDQADCYCGEECRISGQDAPGVCMADGTCVISDRKPDCDIPDGECCRDPVAECMACMENMTTE